MEKEGEIEKRGRNREREGEAGEERKRGRRGGGRKREGGRRGRKDAHLLADFRDSFHIEPPSNEMNCDYDYLEVSGCSILFICLV